MASKGKGKSNKKSSTPQKKPAATASSEPMPDGWKQFGKWRIPAHWVDETPERSGKPIGIVGSPFKPKH